jgi:DNA ligase-4
VAVTDILAGKELCVLNGSDEYPKEELERIIAKHGGTKVQTPLATTFCALAGTETVRVQSIIAAHLCDVIDIAWLVACDRESRFVPISPQYIRFATEQTKEKIEAEYDRFGDSFTEDATPESLRRAFVQVGKQLKRSEPPIQTQTIQEINALHPSLSFAMDVEIPDATTSSTFDTQEVDVAKLETHYLKAAPWWAIFRPHVVCFDVCQELGNAATKIASSKLLSLIPVVRFFGGSVSDRITPETTRIIVDQADQSRLQAIWAIARRAQDEPPHVPKRIVSGQWITDSIRSSECLDEFAYLLLPSAD